MYGCHDLRRDDLDRDPDNNNAPRWGGVANAPAATPACPQAPAPVAPDADNNLAIPEHVRQLQEDLRTLGFLVVGQPGGRFDRRTEWAVREFQCYAKMAHVARIRAGVPQAAQQGAHLVAQEGQQGNLSVYVDSLEQVQNDALYAGPVSGVVNAATRTALEHWLTNNWRCPVIVEAWTLQGGNRQNLFQHNGNWAVNLWLHDDLPSAAPRMYVRDFTGYYTMPPGRNADDMHVLGDFVTYLQWSGPRSIPPRHTWAEGEILPDRLVGVQNMNAAQESTFKVIRAVSEVECLGFFDSVNSYDNAFVSVGPCHWTLGIISAQGVFSNGELCGYLAYLRHADNQAFQDAFEFFGIRVHQNWVDATGQGTGAALFSANTRKYSGWVAVQQEDGSFAQLGRTEADGDYFKTWHWFYRFVMAGRTVGGYRERMWHMSRVRIRDIRNVPWGAGVANIPDGSPDGRPATIGDVFTSERAMAIILRWHIRFPAHMVTGGNAGQRLQNALNRATGVAVAGGWNGAPNTWVDAHEAQLVQELLTEAQNHGNQGLINSITYVNNWPNWLNAANPRGYTLAAPVANLSQDRDSLDFDTTGLPPAPP